MTIDTLNQFLDLITEIKSLQSISRTRTENVLLHDYIRLIHNINPSVLIEYLSLYYSGKSRAINSIVRKASKLKLTFSRNSYVGFSFEYTNICRILEIICHRYDIPEIDSIFNRVNIRSMGKEILNNHKELILITYADE